jgi:hypothetical protein
MANSSLARRVAAPMANGLRPTDERLAFVALQHAQINNTTHSHIEDILGFD